MFFFVEGREPENPEKIPRIRMIIARYDVILDQSECAHLYNHLSNYTKRLYVFLFQSVSEFVSLEWIILLNRAVPKEMFHSTIVT